MPPIKSLSDSRAFEGYMCVLIFFSLLRAMCVCGLCLLFVFFLCFLVALSPYRSVWVYTFFFCWATTTTTGTKTSICREGLYSADARAVGDGGVLFASLFSVVCFSWLSHCTSAGATHNEVNFHPSLSALHVTGLLILFPPSSSLHSRPPSPFSSAL